MKRIYTFLTFVMACLTASYAQDWQVTITKDDGLPGNESNGKCVFTSDVIKLDSPTATIRLTSISNDVYEKESGQSAAQNRLSAGICDVAQRRVFGNQHPILSIAELVIYDADGNSIAYTPSTNSPEPDGGFMAMFGMGGYQSPEIDKIKETERKKLEKAKQKDLLIVPGDGFGCPGWFRLCYCVSYEQIQKSLPVFASLIQKGE